MSSRTILFELLLVLIFISAIGPGRSLAADAAERAAAQEGPGPAGLSGAAAPPESGANAKPDQKEDFDFFSDKPVIGAQVVELPLPKPAWITTGGPIALILFFFALNLIIWRLVPFAAHSIDINLRDLPPAAKRGIAMAVVIFGIAFCFGAAEIFYQLKLHGSALAYFEQMSLGKLIAFTHAHLFGFTTSFFIIGIPFSIQFNQIKIYQWVFPVGLAASLTDVMSWWGIKYLSSNFEWVSIFCAVLFGVSYVWMLIGLLRVLLFPEVIWFSDKDKEVRLAQRRAKEAIARTAKRNLDKR